MAEHVEVDAAFGEVRLLLDEEAGLAQAAGTALPTATLHRAGPARRNSYAPIGTRSAADLALDVDGAPAELVLGPGGVTRRSYRVDVRRAGPTLRLQPSGAERSTLLRDGTRLGRLWAVPGAGVSAQWTEAAGPDDAAVGYLLATAFGTGAQHVLVSLVSGFFHA